MEHTLAEAAEIADVNRSTILRSIKSGKLSARRLEDKSYRVEASELARVYELRPSAQAVHEAMPRSAQAPHEHAQDTAQSLDVGEGTRIELAELRLEVRLLREQLERERQVLGDTVDDLRSRLDQEQEERRALQRQIAPPIAQPAPQSAQERPVEASTMVELAKPPRGFLSRLLGR